MSEVGEGNPFDVMLRGQYSPEKEDVDSPKIGSEPVSVEADIASFDLDGRYFILYDVDFPPLTTDIGPGRDISEGRKLSTLVKGLEEEWGYEITSIPYDKEAPVDEDLSMVQGTVYWPDLEEFSRDEAYEDFVDLTGSDILSEL